MVAELPRKPKNVPGIPDKNIVFKFYKDTYGFHWEAPAEPPSVGPKGEKFEGLEKITVWWDRDMKRRHDEQLIIRQDNSETKADVIQLSLGQVYALIAILNRAVVNQ